MPLLLWLPHHNPKLILPFLSCPCCQEIDAGCQRTVEWRSPHRTLNIPVKSSTGLWFRKWTLHFPTECRCTPRFPTHCFYWKYFNLYVYVCMSIEVCSHECGWPLRPGQRASDSLGVVNYPIWVVGSVLRSSKRGVYTLNYWSHLSSPHIYFKILVACDLKLFLRVKQNTITRQRSSETLKSYLSW